MSFKKLTKEQLLVWVDKLNSTNSKVVEELNANRKYSKDLENAQDSLRVLFERIYSRVQDLALALNTINVKDHDPSAATFPFIDDTITEAIRRIRYATDQEPNHTNTALLVDVVNDYLERANLSKITSVDDVGDMYRKIGKLITSQPHSDKEKLPVENEENQHLDVVVVIRQLPNKKPVVHSTYFRSPNVDDDTLFSTYPKQVHEDITTYLKNNPDMDDAEFHTQILSIPRSKLPS